jgi:hypothetical protein
MWITPHNECDHDTVQVSRGDRSWNNKQIHAEVLGAGQHIIEWKIQVSQAWPYGGYSTQETAQESHNTQERRRKVKSVPRLILSKSCSTLNSLPFQITIFQGVCKSFKKPIWTLPHVYFLVYCLTCNCINSKGSISGVM